MSQTAHWEPIFGICFYFYPCIFRLSNVEPVYLERYKTVNEICEKNELFSGVGAAQTRSHSSRSAWTNGMLLGAGALGLTCAYLTTKAFALNKDPVLISSF